MKTRITKKAKRAAYGYFKSALAHIESTGVKAHAEQHNLVWVDAALKAQARGMDPQAFGTYIICVEPQARDAIADAIKADRAAASRLGLAAHVGETATHIEVTISYL